MTKYQAHTQTFDVIVIGAGHAGCEAALAAARRGARVLVLTPNLDRIGYMPCNPSIGGPAKGHLVAEVDALGGEMGRAADRTALQVRLLNTGKGPAVQALRAQCDKSLYALVMKEALESQPGVILRQDEAIGLQISKDRGGERVCGVLTRGSGSIAANAVVVTAGTFLRANLVRGDERTAGGRAGEHADTQLATALAGLGLATRRFKTGTPPRIDARTVDFGSGTLQPGNDDPGWFSHDGRSGRIAPIVLPPIGLLAASLPGYDDSWAHVQHRPQLACLRIDTNSTAHAIITANLHRAPMFNGSIDGVGPRYCPSIEDKVHRFSDKDSHPLYLEPEGWRTTELYVQGMSTSLPADIQDQVVRTIPALENAHITRYGYAVEYDALDPNELALDLQAKRYAGLFFAGQVNGTSGYEEAAAQGIVAGANAAAHAIGGELLVLRRDEAYTGVMIDDLVTRPFSEPYRMLTSRAEHRLLLRVNTAPARLTARAFGLGLVDEHRYQEVMRAEQIVDETLASLKDRWFSQTPVHRDALRSVGIHPADRQQSAYDLLRRPDVPISQVAAALRVLGDMSLTMLPKDTMERVDHAAKYIGFINRAEREVVRHRGLENHELPDMIDYRTIAGLRFEAQEQLGRVKPRTIGQAGRLAGVTPSDIAALLIHSARQETSG